MDKCSLCHDVGCHDVGWVIEAKLKLDGVATLEIIPCLIPDCPHSGRRIELVSLDMMRMTKVCLHPKERFVMSVSKGTDG